MSDVVFLDVETTGLDTLCDEVWEFAAIRRFASGSERTWHFQIHHDPHLAARLPEPFFADYTKRFDPAKAVDAAGAAAVIERLMSGRPHIVGVNPAFDAAMLTRLLARFSDRPMPWHYHLIDLPAMTLGYRHALGHMLQLPWKSDDLAASVGAPTTDADGYALYDRHTALGDAQWCRAWFDALLSSPTVTEAASAQDFIRESERKARRGGAGR